MYAVRCVCGRHTAFPNALVCPFCKKVLVDMSDEFIMKHISRCAKSIAPKTYSFRKRGRPAEIADTEEKIPPIFRNCDNCGADCQNKSELCSRWTPMEPRICPFCGQYPSKTFQNGVMTSLRCDTCNLTMNAYNVRNGDILLIQMWNTRINR